MIQKRNYMHYDCLYTNFELIPRFGNFNLRKTLFNDCDICHMVYITIR